MPQSSHRLRNDLKFLEWDVKPHYTHTLSCSKRGERRKEREGKGKEERGMGIIKGDLSLPIQGR